MLIRPIEPGSPDFHRLEAALADSGLPVGDLLFDPAIYYAAGDENAPSAFGGLLLLGDEALLRSVTVPRSERGQGRGKRLVDALADMARSKGAKRLWLLTTTVEGFFERQGWNVVNRRETPACIAATYQFASTCPASAVLMCRPLA